jgi:phage tail-like protein
MSISGRNEPYLGFNFLVEIQGIIVGGFSEVSGLQAEIEVQEIKEGGVNDHVHKVPKSANYSNIILKRGITDSDELWKWHQDVINGIICRKSVFIIILDSIGNEKWRWNCIDAYPVKWMGPALRSDRGAVAFEEVELAHHGFKKA